MLTSEVKQRSGLLSTVFRTLLVACVENEERRWHFCQRDVCQSAFLLIPYSCISAILSVSHPVSKSAHKYLIAGENIELLSSRALYSMERHLVMEVVFSVLRKYVCAHIFSSGAKQVRNHILQLSILSPQPEKLFFCPYLAWFLPCHNFPCSFPPLNGTKKNLNKTNRKR